MTTVKPTRVFTREDPCTKVHIYNCFRDGPKFRRVPVVESRGWIGLNTPKYLKREGFMEMVSGAKVDYYQLTKEGEKWLLDGLKRHLELHPQDVHQLMQPTPFATWQPATKVKRRPAVRAMPAPKTAVAKPRIIRRAPAR